MGFQHKFPEGDFTPDMCLARTLSNIILEEEETKKEGNVELDRSNNTNNQPENLSLEGEMEPTNQNQGQGESGSPTLRTALPTPIRYVLRLVRDFVTFLVRGGLSTVHFIMDQILAFFLVMLELILGERGASFVAYPARVALWLYELFMWVIYVTLELFFYFPWKLKLLYLAFLFVVYLHMPDYFIQLIASVRWTLHVVLKFLRFLLSGWDSSNYNSDDKVYSSPSPPLGP